MKTAILQIFRKINNSLPSRHSTKDLLPCHNCGKQPKMGYSHSGAWIGCSCGQLIYVGFGNDLDLASAWDRMNETK